MNLFTIALKDLTRSLRSLFAVGMMVAAPLMIVGLIYFAFGGMSSGETAKIADVRVAVVNLDTPPAGQDALGGQLLSMLQDERMPDWLLASPYDSEAAARSALQRQEIAAAVIVPADFTAQLMSADGHTELRLIHDPTLSISPTILRLLLTQYADTVSAMRVAVNVLPEPTPEAVQPLVSSYSAWLTAFLNNLNHSPEPYLQVLSPAQQQDSTSATATRRSSRSPRTKLAAARNTIMARTVLDISNSPNSLGCEVAAEKHSYSRNSPRKPKLAGQNRRGR